MARSNNFLLNKLSGQLAKQLLIKQYGDLTVLSKYPDMSRRKLSTKQLEVNEKMAEANYEAKRIIANPDLCSAAQTKLNVTRNKLYTALIKDYFMEQPLVTAKYDLGGIIKNRKQKKRK